MSPDFFKKNPFPVRQDSVMTDDSPPLSLDEIHMMQREEENSRYNKNVLSTLLSVFK